jgi:hypothetical protein
MVPHIPVTLEKLYLDPNIRLLVTHQELYSIYTISAHIPEALHIPDQNRIHETQCCCGSLVNYRSNIRP